MGKKIKIFSNGKEIFYRSKNTIILPKKIFQSDQIFSFNNKLLHPEDKLIRKPIIHWVEEIHESLKDINSLTSLIDRIEKVAMVFNHATYIMAIIGDFKMRIDFVMQQYHFLIIFLIILVMLNIYFIVFSLG